MSYTKLWKACVDAPLGFQTINKIIGNIDAMRVDLEVEHTKDNSQVFQPGSTLSRHGHTGPLIPFSPALQTGAALPGSHTGPLIPIGVAWVEQTTTDPTQSSTYGVQVSYSAGALQQMQVIAAGLYFFPISGFTEVWGRATPAFNDAGAGLAAGEDAIVSPGLVGGLGSTGLTVRTYRAQDGGGGVAVGQTGLGLFHTGFFLIAFGIREGVFNPFYGFPFEVCDEEGPRPVAPMIQTETDDFVKI